MGFFFTHANKKVWSMLTLIVENSNTQLRKRGNCTDSVLHKYNGFVQIRFSKKMILWRRYFSTQEYSSRRWQFRTNNIPLMHEHKHKQKLLRFALVLYWCVAFHFDLHFHLYSVFLWWLTTIKQLYYYCKQASKSAYSPFSQGKTTYSISKFL